RLSLASNRRFWRSPARLPSFLLLVNSPILPVREQRTFVNSLFSMEPKTLPPAVESIPRCAVSSCGLLSYWLRPIGLAFAPLIVFQSWNKNLHLTSLWLTRL